MVIKNSTVYVCSNCDAQYPRWVGRCSECGKFGTISSEPSIVTKTKNISNMPTAGVVSLRLGAIKPATRFSSGLSEVDRVLGGGLPQGGVLLLTGAPGAGKSTLVLAVADGCGQSVLYASGEESAEQIEQRANRLLIKGDKLNFTTETNVQSVAQAVRQSKCRLLIIDSLQTVVSSETDGAPGSPRQLKAVLAELVGLAKMEQISVLVIGHVTKEGVAAGPRTVEHLVDVVLALESLERQDIRILRSTKNRFGSTEEIGVFQMEQGGLKQVNNPSVLFLAERHSGAGSCVTAIQEGSRSLLVEVQALVTRSTKFSYPKRATTGYDANRLQLLLAVLEEKVGVRLGYNDVYVNLAGGLKSRETALDLAVCLAMVSAKQKKPIANNLVVFGEVGLGGEVRPVNAMEKRLQEASRLGFKQAVVPKLSDNINLPKGLQVSFVRNLTEAIEWL